MVASTTQGIRYPQVADRPLDFAGHLGDMARDIDTLMASHDVDLDRTLDDVPMMMLRLSLPVQLVNSISTPTSGVGDPVPFDSIETQRGGVFARLGVSRSLFRMPRTGYYQVGLDYHMGAAFDPDDPSNVLQSQWNFNLVRYPATLEPIRQQHVDSLSTVSDAFEGDDGERGSVSGLIRATTVSDYFFWSFFAVGTAGSFEATVPMFGARAYAYWTADL